MIRLVHISDLHFGRDDATLVGALHEAIAAARPDVVAVTGDLTQRARDSQFRAARAFLDQLPAPWICVPGNHDIPLHNPLARLFRPYAGYKRHISRVLDPDWRSPELILQGLNTANPLAWQRGRLRRGSLDRICRGFAGQSGARVVMAHHPFQQSPESHKQLMPDAGPALRQLAECGTDILLSGHLHLWRAEPFLEMKGEGRILQVHVGTGLSTRLRGQDNDFAVLEIEGGTCLLRRMVAQGGRFVEQDTLDFSLNPKRPSQPVRSSPEP